MVRISLSRSAIPLFDRMLHYSSVPTDIRNAAACSGTACSYSGPGNIQHMGGIYAAHEQIQISGNPNIFGFMISEDALDCSDTVDGQGRGASTINGSPQVFYDCQHPPNPWATTADFERVAWQEID